VVAIAALALGVYATYRSVEADRRSVEAERIARTAIGQGLSAYDLSSPQKAIESVQRMARTYDLRTALDYLKLLVKSEKGAPTILLTSDSAVFNVARAVPVGQSGWESNKGLIVAFVKIVDRGVENNDVLSLRSDSESRFYFAVPYFPVPPNRGTDDDRKMNAMIERWKQSGQLDAPGTVAR
jgi:hypothetical protein